MLALVERLMSAGVGGSNEVIYNEFPSTQLPATTVQQPAHAVFLSPFEFFFYHFANAPVRKHQLAGGLSGSSMVTSAILGHFLCIYFRLVTFCVKNYGFYEKNIKKNKSKLKRNLKTQEKKLKTQGKNSMSRRIAPLLTSQVMLKKPDLRDCLTFS